MTPEEMRELRELFTAWFEWVDFQFEKLDAGFDPARKNEQMEPRWREIHSRILERLQTSGS